jgi:hypothetical protein
VNADHLRDLAATIHTARTQSALHLALAQVEDQFLVRISPTGRV